MQLFSQQSSMYQNFWKGPDKSQERPWNHLPFHTHRIWIKSTFAVGLTFALPRGPCEIWHPSCFCGFGRWYGNEIYENVADYARTATRELMGCFVACRKPRVEGIMIVPHTIEPRIDTQSCLKMVRKVLRSRTRPSIPWIPWEYAHGKSVICRPPGKIPMSTHVEYTERGMDMFVTEQDVTDVHELRPVLTAHRVINNCPQPSYRDWRNAYFDVAFKQTYTKGRGHEP
jgi:hypothetical protein